VLDPPRVLTETVIAVRALLTRRPGVGALLFECSELLWETSLSWQ
jgi:hypothetical protein